MNIPKGYKLVPVEPTAEMLIATEAIDAGTSHRGAGEYELCNVGDYWEAMLSAAPTPPQPIYDEAKELKSFKSFWASTMNTEEMDLHIHRYPMGKGWAFACHETNRGWMSWVARAKAGGELPENPEAHLTINGGGILSRRINPPLITVNGADVLIKDVALVDCTLEYSIHELESVGVKVKNVHRNNFHNPGGSYAADLKATGLTEITVTSGFRRSYTEEILKSGGFVDNTPGAKAGIKPTECTASTCNQIREESGLPANHPCQACGRGACIDR